MSSITWKVSSLSNAAARRFSVMSCVMCEGKTVVVWVVDGLFWDASSTEFWIKFAKECIAVSMSDGGFKEMLRVMALSLAYPNFFQFVLPGMIVG